MKILIVAMVNSIHTARWISQINKREWEIYVYPSTQLRIIHPLIGNFCNINFPHLSPDYLARELHFRSISGKNTIMKFFLVLLRAFYYIIKNIIGDSSIIKTIKQHFILSLFPEIVETPSENPNQELARIIDKIKPDIIHSLEIQAAGYLTLEVKQKYFQNKKFPKWIITNWGSDIYLYGKLKEHQEKIKQVLAECDYYSCECHRDIYLAKQFGFKAKTLPVFPNAGGFDLETIANYRQPGLTSDRKVIMLKGYQTWAGRALCGLRALERCAELLTGYQVVLYSAPDDVKLAAELFSVSTGIQTKILPTNTAHAEILKYHGQARISIGVSISDAISTSLLEAIVMGSFPIQSWTSCANEWIKDGETGLLIPPEDPEIIEQAIRRALTDDQLVNNGVEKNLKMAKSRLDSKIIQPMAVNFYETVFNDL